MDCTVPQNEFILDDPRLMIDSSLQSTFTDLDSLFLYAPFPLQNLNTNQPSQSVEQDFSFQGALPPPLSASTIKFTLTPSVTTPPYFTSSPLSELSTPLSQSIARIPQSTTLPSYHCNEPYQCHRLQARTRTNITTRIRPNINKSKPLLERSGLSDSVYGKAVSRHPSSHHSSTED